MPNLSRLQWPPAARGRSQFLAVPGARRPHRAATVVQQRHFRAGPLVMAKPETAPLLSCAVGAARAASTDGRRRSRLRRLKLLRLSYIEEISETI